MLLFWVGDAVVGELTRTSLPPPLPTCPTLLTRHIYRRLPRSIASSPPQAKNGPSSPSSRTALATRCRIRKSWTSSEGSRTRQLQPRRLSALPRMWEGTFGYFLLNYHPVPPSLPRSGLRRVLQSFLLLLLPRLYHSEGTDLSLSDPQRGQHDLHRDPSPRLGSHGRSRRQRFSARLQAATEHRRQLEAEEDVGRSARWSLGWEILVREKLGAGRAPRREGCRRWEGGQNRILLQLCCITTRGDRCGESEIRNVSELEPLQPRQPLGRRSTASLSPTLHSSSRRLVFASPAAYKQPISRSTSTTTAFLRSEMPRSRAPATAPSMQQSR